MGWVTGIVVYVIVWWVTLFAVLPLWVTPSEPNDPGHADRRIGSDLAADPFRGGLALDQFSRAVS
jgi:predicted secreted protein